LDSDCNPALYKDIDEACKPCPAGSFCPGDDAMHSCWSGYISIAEAEYFYLLFIHYIEHARQFFQEAML